MPTLVYRYGLLPPTAEGERIAEQILLAHRYQNELIAIERKRRTARDQILARDPSYAASNSAIDALNAEITALYAGEQSDETARHIAKLKQERATAYKLRIPVRNAALKLPEIQAALIPVQTAAKEQIRAARETCGVYWGTYLTIEASAEQASKKSFEVEDINFRPWTGDGAVAVQIQKGMPASALLNGSDNRVRFVLTPTPIPGRGGKPLPRLLLRIGTADIGRAPIFGEWPLILHRPIPDGASLKWAKVVRRRMAGKDEWSLHLVLDVPEHAPTEGDTSPLAVNLRWAKGDRPATIVADTASPSGSGELHVNTSVSGELEKVDDLRSIRDNLFNDIKESLHAALKSLTLPPEFAERVQFLRRWRAPGKLAAATIWWRANRFPGDETPFTLAEAWRKKDKHLWCWEHNSRAKALARRKDHYRVYAARAAAAHSSLTIEKLDIARLAKKPKTKEEREDRHHNAKAAAQRVGASPSELRAALVNAFRHAGKPVYEVKAGMTSREMLDHHLSGRTAEIVLKNGHSKRTSRLLKNKGKPKVAEMSCEQPGGA